MADDNVQHGIDDNPSGDAGKGAVLGGVGGAVVGALAGGPVGAVVGAVAGALASGAGVAAVDSVDNDNTVSGIGSDTSSDTDRDASSNTSGDYSGGYSATANPQVTPSTYDTTPGVTGDVGTGYSATSTPGTTADTHNTVGTGYADSDRTDVYAATPATGVTTPAMGVTTPAVDTTRSDMRDDMNNTNATETNADTLRVPVVEETLNVNKGVQQAGEVAVSKHVVEEQVNVPVQLAHEEVTVTRHAVDRPLQAGEQVLDADDVIRVPVMEETVSVDKQAHVAEEIEIRKHAVTEQQTVQDTVRREVVDVDDNAGSVGGTGSTGHSSGGVV
ncbi:MAG TPA: YsnF/AvaK domain-containing protein [Abditibacteriaceae bacterium]|jgi:uncharacterized protein (TIGR02271 family)